MADRVGHQVGHYRLVRLLGQGGFAEVYLGEHEHLGTQAAIKLLHAPLASAKEVETFRNEARTLARLEHPHIVRILDFGLEGNLPYLVMDYAPNGTLRQRFPPETPVQPLTILPSLKQAADALQYAHDQHVIHRDIKPQNLLLNKRQEVLLSDFGIAVVAQSTSQQGTKNFAGTAAYAAPEQLQGRPRPASDQYSLGIMVYEWLTGACPFTGSYLEVASQHVLTALDPLRARVPTLPPPVEAVVLTALEKDPQRRFASVRAFAHAFELACQPPSGPVVQPLSPLSGSFQPGRTAPEAPSLLPQYISPPPVQPRVPAIPSLPQRSPVRPLALVGGGILALVLAVVLVMALMGGKNTNTTNTGGQTGTTPTSTTTPGSTPGATSTPASGPTPVSTGGPQMVSTNQFVPAIATTTSFSGSGCNVTFPRTSMQQFQVGQMVLLVYTANLTQAQFDLLITVDKLDSSGVAIGSFNPPTPQLCSGLHTYGVPFTINNSAQQGPGSYKAEVLCLKCPGDPDPATIFFQVR